MKREESVSAVKTLLEISKNIEVTRLVEFPDQELVAQGFWKAKAIITNFDAVEGSRFAKKMDEFLEVARAKRRLEHAKNVANDLANKIVNATENIHHYFRLSSEELARANVTSGKREEVLKLRPELYGVGLDLRALWRRLKAMRTRRPLKNSGNTSWADSWVAPTVLISALTLLVAIVSIPWWPQWYSWLSIHSESRDVQTGDASGKKNLYEGNIYSLGRKASGQPTSIARQEFLGKYAGLVVEDSGFIVDVDRPLGASYSVTLREQSEEALAGDSITCDFDESWGQKLETVDVPYFVNFRGAISTLSLLGSRVWLDDCEIL